MAHILEHNRQTLGSFFYEKKLIEDFKVKDKKTCSLVFDYIVHSFKQKRISSYISRRLDIMNICGSTIMAIILG